MSRYQFNSRAPLECHPWPHLNRQVGVTAGEPFHHHGMGDIYVDVRRDTVQIDGFQVWDCCPENEVGAQIRQMTLATIADLDRVIAELQRHRGRLLESIDESGEVKPHAKP